ncbi:MAG: tRNA (adenosine(37)-N6)-threonylcarbamoyltransferase complex transferase subunit TsaD [bacterium]|nr:tRNA (adenosine(37)-N6)-threonylcarbamoyltransferase complex transferase subunit TsaD [bacterium]
MAIERKKYLLAIETSCDETSAAVLAFRKPTNDQRPTTNDRALLSHVVSSQIKLHAKYGGVVPMLAAREQLKNIEPVLRETLRTANLDLADMDYFAVTRGPGLVPSLHVGVNYARALAFAHQKPLIGINHLEGHIYSNWLEPIAEISNSQFPPTLHDLNLEKSGSATVVGTISKQTSSEHNLKKISTPITPSLRHSVTFPVLNLIVSGGHTELVLMRGHGRYRIIGETQDDAAGEAFDKIARLFGLSYPGGPALAKLAEKGSTSAFAFPRPMIRSRDFNFSFSGLKTAVLYKLQELGISDAADQRKPLKAINPKLKADLSASSEQAIVDVLVEKTLRAAKDFNVGGVFISGGVSANKKLRKTFAERIAAEFPGIEYRHPDLAYTGDNAAMIAMAAYWRIQNHKSQITNHKQGEWPEVIANANLRIAE